MTETITLQMGPLDGQQIEAEGRPPSVAVPGTYKGIEVQHRYARVTFRRGNPGMVIRYRYVETVVFEDAVRVPAA